MNQYTVVKNQQFTIEAEDPDDAVKKMLAGEGKSSGVAYNVQLRPPAAQAGATTPRVMGVGAKPGG